MTTKILRYVSVGLTTVLAGLAWGETLYMSSGRDGVVYIGAAPVSSSFAAYKDRTERRRKDEVIPEPTANRLLDKSRLDLLVSEVAHGYELDSALLHALISVESRYNPNALSSRGAAGLMQLMPATARRYGVDDALDPEQNLRGGAKYLRDLLAMFGSDVRLALAAYHAGERTVVKYQNSMPPLQATINFVNVVLERYHKFRNASGH